MLLMIYLCINQLSISIIKLSITYLLSMSSYHLSSIYLIVIPFAWIKLYLKLIV